MSAALFTLSLFVGFATLSLAGETVSIEVESVGEVVKSDDSKEPMNNMLFAPVEAPLSTYADVPDRELSTSPKQQTVRFLLPLPQALIAIEFSVTIDGKPFRAIRQERIERLLLENESDSTLTGRYQQYRDTTQRDVTPDELRWLMRRWGNGASLVLLSENFERARAGQSPGLDVLDVDGNGVLSTGEMESAEQSLRRCDTNQDDVIQMSELVTAANSQVRERSTWDPPERLIATSDVAELSRSLERLLEYSRGTNRSSLTSQLESVANQHWVTSTPALTIKVDFGTQSATCNIMSANSIQPALLAGNRAAVFTTGGADIEVSSVRAVDSSNSGQVSIGVVNDGYPVAPLLDKNHDGRLTTRELRIVTDALKKLDRDGDDALGRDEMRPVIRVCIGHGLCVHQKLSSVREVHPVDHTASSPAPDWFASLDQNRDGDLSQSEFVGTKEQFEKLDANNDKLISIEEAVNTNQ